MHGGAESSPPPKSGTAFVRLCYFPHGCRGACSSCKIPLEKAELGGCRREVPGFWLAGSKWQPAQWSTPTPNPSSCFMPMWLCSQNTPQLAHPEHGWLALKQDFLCRSRGEQLPPVSQGHLTLKAFSGHNQVASPLGLCSTSHDARLPNCI